MGLTVSMESYLISIAVLEDLKKLQVAEGTFK